MESSAELLHVFGFAEEVESECWFLVSLHIRSMWETICDALASWSGWKFGSKIPVYPIVVFGSPPPPPKNGI